MNQIRIFHSREKTETDKTESEIEDQQDSTFSFILDGLNMLIRSTLLQVDLFLEHIRNLVLPLSFFF